MGEEDAKNVGEKKPTAADPGPKKDDGSLSVDLKTDMHCEGCAKKIKRAAKNFQGVEQGKTECAANKLTVDPAGLKEKLEQKIKKKVDLISPQPKKDGGGDKKPAAAEEKAEKKKTEEKKPAEEKKPKESTVVMKIRLHCDGCMQKDEE